MSFGKRDPDRDLNLLSHIIHTLVLTVTHVTTSINKRNYAWRHILFTLENEFNNNLVLPLPVRKFLLVSLESKFPVIMSCVCEINDVIIKIA